MFEVIIAPEVEDDLALLPDDVVDEALEYFDKYADDPFKYSRPLYKIKDIDLRGCRKSYVANATYRIVIKVENTVVNIVEVIAVGKRKNLQVYYKALQRVQQQ